MTRSVHAFHRALYAGALCLALCAAPGSPVLAAVPTPQDYLGQARQLASSGQRPAAIKLLEDRLAAHADDLDARTLLGVILSWEGRYADARKQLRQVLADKPGHYEATVALASVELWDGHARRALGLADEVLRANSKDTGLMLVRARSLSALSRSQEAIDALDRLLAVEPTNAPARIMRDQLADSRRSWAVGAGYGRDTFSDDLTPWQEVWGGIRRQSAVGAFSFEGSQAERYDERDEQYEFEASTRLRPGTYLYLDGGWSSKAILYPEYRAGARLFQALGRGFEGSFGYSRLGFGDGVNIYVGSLSKYIGRWQLIGQLFITPEVDGTNTTYHAALRYYFRDCQYFDVRYQYGVAPERIETIDDLLILESQGVTGDAVFPLGRHLEFTVTASYHDQERVYRGSVKQYSVTSQLYVKF
jgi:YaiO family outer membrane protein